MARRYSKHKKRKTRNKRKKSIKNKRGGGDTDTKIFGLTYDENSPNKYKNLSITECINNTKKCSEGSLSKTFTVEWIKKDLWRLIKLQSIYTEKSMAMKISHTNLDDTNFDIVKRGNEYHGLLQKIINEKEQKQENSKFQINNYYIIKLYAITS